jgi:hypothetical protein
VEHQVDHGWRWHHLDLMKIALLGSAPSSRLLAPFNDPSWEIWACSPANMDLPRSDVFFEIHAMDTTLREPQYADFVKWCAKHPKVYMQEKRPEFPGAIVYPKDEMFKKFGPYFFTSSLSYMLALAIDKKPEAIGLFGVDMSAGDEYGYQRAGCHYFIQEAERAGIDLVVPFESDILEPPPPYGYREASRMWWKVNTRWKELHGKRQAVEAKLAELEAQRAVLMGAMDDAQYICNTYYSKEK